MVATAVGAALVLVSAGCGGTRQDADEPSGDYAVQVTRATFPSKQQIAQTSRMVIAVKNTGRETIPNVAVTVDSFNTREQRADLADPTRPVWIVDKGPADGETAYVGTWALGHLAPGRTARFTWRVTAVRPGTHAVKYRVAAGLDGKAKAVLPGGGVPAGIFPVEVERKPEAACVNDAGEVVRSPKRTHDNSCKA